MSSHLRPRGTDRDSDLDGKPLRRPRPRACEDTAASPPAAPPQPWGAGPGPRGVVLRARPIRVRKFGHVATGQCQVLPASASQLRPTSAKGRQHRPARILSREHPGQRVLSSGPSSLKPRPGKLTATYGGSSLKGRRLLQERGRGRGGVRRRLGPPRRASLLRGAAHRPCFIMSRSARPWDPQTLACTSQAGLTSVSRASVPVTVQLSVFCHPSLRPLKTLR